MENVQDPPAPQPTAFREPRRHSRAPAQLEAWLHLGRREVPAVALDISPGGAFLRCDVEDLGLQGPGARLVATLQLPQGRSLSVMVEVRWQGTLPRAPGLGVRFLSFLPPGVHAF